MMEPPLDVLSMRMGVQVGTQSLQSWAICCEGGRQEVEIQNLGDRCRLPERGFGGAILGFETSSEG